MRAACSGNGDRGVNPTIQALRMEWANAQLYWRVHCPACPCWFPNQFPNRNSIPKPSPTLSPVMTRSMPVGWRPALLFARGIAPRQAFCTLYHKGEKVIVSDDFRSQGQEVSEHPGLPFDARALDSFAKGKSHGVWFLCNPVDGKFHLNDDGKQSRRSRQSVTSWRFLLLESDRADISAWDWLATLALLPLPVVSICETGGRLAHALLQADAPGKESWDRIKDGLAPVLTMIGADIGSLSAVRLTRLPCCERLGKEDKDGKYQRHTGGPRLQRLLYLNPAPDGTPIAQQKAWPMPAPPANPGVCKYYE